MVDDAIASLVRSHRDHIIGELRHLVQVAEGGHDAIQTHVAQRLEAAGATVDDVRYRPRDITVAYEIGSPSAIEGDARYVVGTFGSGAGGVLFWAHSDSEPVDPTGWSRALFGAETVDGRMHGWGIGDDLVGVAMMIAAAQLYGPAEGHGSGRLSFASLPSKRRAQAIIHALDRGYGGAGTVYLHPAESGVGLNEVKAITSGLLRVRVRVYGKAPDTLEPSHTPFLHTGVDPVPIAADLVKAFVRLGDERAARVRYGPIHDAVGRSTNVHVSHVQAGRPDRLSQVPEHVDLTFSCTFPPTEQIASVQAEMAAVIDAVEAQHQWLQERPCGVTWLVGIQGAETPLDSAVYRHTSSAIAMTTGREPHVNPMHAASDIRNPVMHKGIPTVGIGPLVGGLTVSGGVDEWADLDDFVHGVEVVVRIARAFVPSS